MSSNGTSAHINVAGVKAEEYASTHEELGKRTTCFIESVQGKNFEVCFNTVNALCGYSVSVKLDGEEQVRRSLLAAAGPKLSRMQIGRKMHANWEVCYCQGSLPFQ